MTRKRKNKPKSKAAQNQVKSTSKKDSDRMDRDVEDPQGGTRKQESSWKMFTGYIRHPSRFIDLIFSTVVRIQLFMYQRVAGRFPLFLEEKVENYKQERTDLTLAVNELKKTKKQLSNDNESLNKTHTELLNANTTLAEDNEELEKSKQKLSDAVQELTNNTDILKDKDELFGKNKDLGDKNRKLTYDIKCKANKIEELEITIKKLQDGNKQLEGTNTELGNNNKVLAGDIKRLEDTNKKLENKNAEVTLKHAELAESNIELNKSNDELKRKEKLQSEQIKSQQTQITKKDMAIENLTQIKEEGEHKVAMMSDQIKSLKQEVSIWQDKLTEAERKNTELVGRIHTLNDEKNVMEAEKHDALRRLSEQVSVKLRDKNPNIVDLSDQCRPTKLAEMFSELYDNEWTNAFSVLEDTFTEEQTIVILLDTIMIAYGFCEKRVNEPWQALVDWFLDENLPGAQQTTKWLKDSRKTNIQEKVPEIEKNFSETILSICDNENLEQLLGDNDVKIYFTKCIELCLLMVATDPPVVLVCPGWKASPSPQKDGTKTNENPREEKPVSEESEKEISSQIESIKVSDNNQHTRGIDEKASADEAETSGVEEPQDETEKSCKNQLAEMIDRSQSSSNDSMEQGKNDSRQQQEQQYNNNQQQKNGLMHVDMEESRSIGELQQEDQEQLLVQDQFDGTSHSVTNSVVLEGSSLTDLQGNYQENEQEQENGDNTTRDEGDLTNIQQQEVQKEGSNENVVKDEYEKLVDATEKDEMEELQQTGQQEHLDDTKACVSHKEKHDESQLQDTDLIAGDDSKIFEKKDAYGSQARQLVGYETLGEVKFDRDNDTNSAAMAGNSDQEVTHTLYKKDINEGMESLPNDTEDPQEGLVYSNENSFDVADTIEDTVDNIGEDKNVHLPLETVRNKNDTNENNDVPGDSPINDQHNNGNAKAANDEMKQATPVLDEKRPLFDKDLFKEYTRRGKYLDYIVWPAMCLHKDGPLLHKGVAQGRKDQNLVQTGEGWTWRSSN